MAKPPDAGGPVRSAMVTVAPLSESDHDDWLPLWEGYLGFYQHELDTETTEATFTRAVSGVSGMHGAIARDEQGHALGIVHWLTHGSTWSMAGYCYLEDLYVAAEARGGGGGAALIGYVRDWAVERGSAKLYWLTAETNEQARRLYDRVAVRSGHIQYEIKL